MTSTRRSACGETCCVQIAGVCNHNPETTVLAHINIPGYFGVGLKASDYPWGVYSCSDCHDAIDGRRRMDNNWPEEKWFYIARALGRTHAAMLRNGELKRILDAAA